MKLFLGNKAYSSWSLRGWLAVKHSGLPFEEVTVPLYDEDWSNRREGDEFAPSGGKVPILWDGDDIVVWDSLAELLPEVQADVVRIFQIWAEARARFGGEGDYLFGDWSAADIMFAPVVTRFVTYSIPLPRFAAAYCQAVISHPCMQEWIGGAQAEDWVIEAFEGPVEG